MPAAPGAHAGLMSPAEVAVMAQCFSEPLPGLSLGKDHPKAVYLKSGQQLRHILNLFP